MDRVTIDLTNCYGIKKLKYAFDFSQMRAYALYAPNGVMKSSLAQTFQDLATGAPSAVIGGPFVRCMAPQLRFDPCPVQHRLDQ